MKKTLGILGGIGPMSSAYFYKLIIEKTPAIKDQDHIDIVISSKASIPDRTAFILDRCKENPLPIMISEAKKLEAFGAQVIAMPCNTAHYFYEKIQDELNVPLLNIGELAVNEIKKRGLDCIGLMATSGTVKAGIYQEACAKLDIKCILPKSEQQEMIMDIIYNEIKANKKPSESKFFDVANTLKKQGAQAVILACTELSLIKESGILDESYIDALEILALASIEACISC